MNKTQVFLSSTCYDLSALRESVRLLLMKLGHEPVLSEYPSFPVSPDETAIENCKRNVRKHADILVLIIGGKRGSLDAVTGKSITNLEYDEARGAGKPCFVFIQRMVNGLLPLWKKSPDADFTPHVDFPDVFKFIDRIRGENRWTFFFENTAEIEETLVNQFSGMFKELLERSRQGTLDPVADFRSDSEEAQRLARDKPEDWEYLLSAELLRTRLKAIRRKYDQVQSGHCFVAARTVSGPQFLPWIQDQMNNAGKITTALDLQVSSYHHCWGPPGTPGNLLDIKLATDDLTELAWELVEWAKSNQSINPPALFEPCRAAFCRVMESHLINLESLPDQLESLPARIEAMLKEGAPAGSRCVIALDIKGEGFYPVSTELNRVHRLMQRNPEVAKEAGF